MAMPDNLPERLQCLVDLVGFDAAIALVDTHGGTRIFIPTSERLTAEHPLANLLGVEAACRFAKRYGGADWSVPLGVPLKRIAAVRLYRDGASAKSLARRYGVTESAIYRWVAGDDAQRYRSRNGDLFEDASGS
jgi:hypothetical protein